MHPYASVVLLTTIISNAICLNFITSEDPSLQIQLPDGLIQGKLKHTVDTDMPYYSYEGIPYAKPPVGDLRFESPQPVEKWEGVLNADGDVPCCMQLLPGKYEDEDCLYINVYVPKDENGVKPVMVWIYGGGFVLGAANSNIYGPDYFLEKGVIIVHFNYRLNVFGFLATNDTVLPGNYGLKDQLAALRWVHNNINLFGGDPEKITIFGESAGAASVGYLVTSPKARGLFQRVISQSGTPLCSWALQKDPLKVTKKIATSAGLFFGDSISIIQHLKRMNSSTLRTAARNAVILDSFNPERSLTFAPVLEPDHEDAFITETTFESFKRGEFEKIPYILGFNSQESAYTQKAIEFAKPLLNILPNDILIPSSMNNRDSRIGDEIRDYYFRDETKSRTEQYVEFLSDTSFNRAIIETGRLFANHAPVYMYRFAYEGYYLGTKAIPLKDNNVQGVSHSEELWYLFNRRELQHANLTDKLIRDRMVTLWTDFAEYGNPTPDHDKLNMTWPKFEKDDYSYLNIDSEFRIEHNFKAQTMEFWRKLFAKYSRPPFRTY